MQKYKIWGPILIILFIAVYSIQFCNASEGYVGIKEGDEFIWKLEIDEDLADDIFEDSEVYGGPRTSDDIWEPNNNFLTAKDPGLGFHIDLNYSDTDWYKIYCTWGDNLSVELGSQPDMELYFYNLTEGLICYSNTTGSMYQFCKIQCNYTGYYYIKVTNETITAAEGWIMYALEIERDKYHPPKVLFDLRGLVEDFVDDYYDWEGIKMKIKKIRDEDYHKKSDRWVKGVKVYCKILKTEDFDDVDAWKVEDDNEDYVIVDSDESDYHRNLDLIIADNVDWDDTADDVITDYELSKIEYHYHYGTFAYDLKDVEASDRDNGLEISFELYNNEMDDVEIYLDYDDNGVLEQCEIEYGGVTVMKIDLEKGLIEEILEDPVLLALAIGLFIALIAAGITTFFLLRRRKRRRLKN